MAEPTARATLADLRAVPDHLIGEIIDGDLVTRPRSVWQSAAVLRLMRTLATKLDPSRARPTGWSFLHKPVLQLGQTTIAPARAGWRGDRLPFSGDVPFVTVVPDWVCEFSSPSAPPADLDFKRRVYAQAGVQYLWLLDPVAGMLEAFGLAGEQWLLLATVLRGEGVSGAPFDAVSFPLDDLFPFKDPSSEA